MICVYEYLFVWLVNQVYYLPLLSIIAVISYQQTYLKNVIRKFLLPRIRGLSRNNAYQVIQFLCQLTNLSKIINKYLNLTNQLFFYSGHTKFDFIAI